uniref:Uncharacterized protein n=1 Tax=Arundo donax TaxID=35708 RepID=A0A0A9FLW6_ARUDO
MQSCISECKCDHQLRSIYTTLANKLNLLTPAHICFYCNAILFFLIASSGHHDKTGTVIF